MKINEVKISKLYGHLSIDIDKIENIFLLVGINGSGKTSVLNVMNWLLVPDFPSLCVYEYDYLSVNFSWSGKECKIKAMQNSTHVKIVLTENGREFNPIVYQLGIHPEKIQSEKHRALLREHYGKMGPSPDEVEAWEYMHKQVPGPLFIGLTRGREENEGDAESQPRVQRARPASSSMVKKPGKAINLAKEIISLEFSDYTQKRMLAGTVLHESIFRSSFSPEALVDLSDSRIGSSDWEINVDLVANLQGKVEKYALENGIKYHGLIEYFTKFKAIVSDNSTMSPKEQSTLRALNRSAYNYAKKMIDSFALFEEDNTVAFSGLRSLLESINNFLADTGKTLFVDPLDGTPKYRFKNNDKIKSDIDTLSSGESQIVILLSYIWRASMKDELIIIDEPELSLHPKWQELFMAEVLKLAGDSSQIIMATHSPEIVGRGKNFKSIGK